MAPGHTGFSTIRVRKQPACSLFQFLCFHYLVSDSDLIQGFNTTSVFSAALSPPDGAKTGFYQQNVEKLQAHRDEEIPKRGDDATAETHDQ